MIPGNCITVFCPSCGGGKDLLQLISGNTFGSVQWSDTKQVAPMLPRLSPVQKCPACGHYYFLSSAKAVDGNDTSSETGWLTFEEAVEAFGMLSDSNSDKLELLALTVVWAFNDIYRNGNVPTTEQAAVFKDLMSGILKQQVFTGNIILKAEFLRETGKFGECIDLLEKHTPENEFLAGIKDKIIKKARAHDDMVFSI